MTDFKQPSNRLQVVRSKETKEKISRSMKENYKKNGFSDERKRRIAESMKRQWKRRKEEFENNIERKEGNDAEK